MTQHASDCAVHNMPAYPNGPCDCGAEETSEFAAERDRYKKALEAIEAAALRNNGPLARDRCEDQMRGIGYHARGALQVETALAEAGAKIRPIST